MRIYPVVSNVVKVELENGTIFELHEGDGGLSIKVLDGKLVAKKLNLDTLELDEIWSGSSITLAEPK